MSEPISRRDAIAGAAVLATGAAALATGLVAAGDEALAANDPHLQKAMNHLAIAKQELQLASGGFGGHRAAAVRLINEAVREVDRAISFKK